MYVCGPTVYGHVHIGNGRPAVVFDMLHRLLKTLYPQVAYVSNITDVDDKINRQAAANGEPIEALTRRFSAAYNEDIQALGVLGADAQPKATEHISEIIRMIEALLDKGFAYAAEDHVLFHVPADPNYGDLSHRSLEDMLDGARVEVAPLQEGPQGLRALEALHRGLAWWESPWGRGRPGWHIECSAMIHAHLGAAIDIHGGGADLCFPTTKTRRRSPGPPWAKPCGALLAAQRHVDLRAGEDVQVPRQHRHHSCAAAASTLGKPCATRCCRASTAHLSLGRTPCCGSPAAAWTASTKRCASIPDRHQPPCPIPAKFSRHRAGRPEGRPQQPPSLGRPARHRPAS